MKRTCQDCKHYFVSTDEPPCRECRDAGGHGNWEPNEEGEQSKKAHDFLEKCDELDAAIFTGDVLHFLDTKQRAEFWDFVSGWVHKFIELENV